MRKKAQPRDEAGHPVHPIPHFKKKVFDEWPLKNGDTVCVGTDYDAGYDLVHIRRYRRGSNGKLYPTEKGIAVAVGDLSRLLKALKQIRDHAREIALLPKPKRQSIHGGRR
jgi:hypothetical protein